MALSVIDHRRMEVNTVLSHLHLSLCILRHLGLVGKIEAATHIDLNGDGFIGGRPGQYRPH